MYKPQPLDVIKYTTMDNDWYIVYVHEIRAISDKQKNPFEEEEVLIEDIAVSNPSDFFDKPIWVDGIFNPESVLDIELLMSNCPNVATFTTTYPEHLL